MEFLIDTSVLVAATLEEAVERKRALGRLGKIQGRKLVNTVVLLEYAGVLHRLVGPDAAGSMVSEVWSAYEYHAVPVSVFLAALPHFRHGVGDAVIGQHAIANGWRLVTLDRGFRRFVPENLLVV